MELNIEDLYIECPECSGSGRTSGPASQANTGTFGRREIWRSGPCEKCNGTGGQFTVAGQTIADFIQILKKRHLL